jgi:hypothetical protein
MLPLDRREGKSFSTGVEFNIVGSHDRMRGLRRGQFVDPAHKPTIAAKYAAIVATSRTCWTRRVLLCRSPSGAVQP